jgi:hypothetical protein
LEVEPEKLARWFAWCLAASSKEMITSAVAVEGHIPYFGDSLKEAITWYKMPDGSFTRDFDVAMRAWMQSVIDEGCRVHPEWEGEFVVTSTKDSEAGR